MLVCDLCLLNPAVLVVSGLSEVLGALRQILLGYLVHMHSRLRSLRQGQVHVVTKPPKSLGPPTVVLVQRTSDNPAGAPGHLTSLVSEFPYLPKSVLPVTQTLQIIGDVEVRK
jgi:hypothetical protein